jgi:hypothetical protein
MRQPLQEFVAAVMMDDSLANNCPKYGHALGQPVWNTPAVKREIGAAGSSCHDGSIRVFCPWNVRPDQSFSNQVGGSGNSSGTRGGLGRSIKSGSIWNEPAASALMVQSK